MNSKARILCTLGECGELGRTVVDIPKKYNLARVIADHLTPNRMYVEGDEDQKKPMGGVKSIGCGAYHCMVIKIAQLLHYPIHTVRKLSDFRLFLWGTLSTALG